MRRSIAATILMLCSVADASSVSADTIQLTIDGQPRTYLVEPSKAGKPSPTVIVLHGAGGTAERTAQQTGLLQLGPQEGFAAVFPQSRANVWNRFLPGKESPQALEFFRKFGGPPNDIGFLKSLIADLVRRGISDPAQIYLAGISNGGFMTLKMFCTEGGPLAGIGLVITSMPEATGEECESAKPLPMLVLNGTADETVPYRGGVVAPLPGQSSSLSVWSTDRLVLHFRKLNGCAQPPENSVLTGQQALKIEVERWTKCTGGPVVSYKVVGGKHGSTQTALNAGKVLLDFFRETARAR